MLFYLLITTLSAPAPTPWTLNVAMREGNFLAWHQESYPSQDECLNDLTRITLTVPVADAYCEREGATA